MRSTKRILLGLAVSFAALGAARAADYDPPIYVEQAAEYVPVEVGSGWYLRGDVGYVFDASIGQVDYRTFDGATYGASSFDSQNISTDFSWGGGFGYRFTDYFRADATVDGFRADFNGSTSSDTACVQPPADDTTCRTEDNSEFSAVSVMANGYVDLGTYIGITPYVGAGVGYSYISWAALQSTEYCVDGELDSCTIPTVGATTEYSGIDGWRFTYALMAGFAYDLTPNMKLDVGYKYRQIDGGDMFAWDAGSAGLGATGTQGTSGDIKTHEIKVGLRYELW